MIPHWMKNKLVKHTADDGSIYYEETPISDEERTIMNYQSVQNVPNSTIEVLDLPVMDFTGNQVGSYPAHAEPDQLDANGLQILALPEMKFDPPEQPKPKPASGEPEILDLPGQQFTNE